ncbi:MAG: hypothetical protein M0Q14_02405 [Tissierellaceae bacterium]|nr:hypothetical protein [Tissierellaceae bacterium]
MLSSEIKKSIGISRYLAKRSIDFQFFNEREKASKPDTKGVLLNLNEYQNEYLN